MTWSLHRQIIRTPSRLRILIPAALPYTLHAHADGEIARHGEHGAGSERDGIHVGRDVAERKGLVRNFDCAKQPTGLPIGPRNITERNLTSVRTQGGKRERAAFIHIRQRQSEHAESRRRDAGDHENRPSHAVLLHR